MAYSYFRTITIDHTKCGSSDSSNFPVAFYGTYSYLATVANGGRLTNANGYDIIFTSDAGGLSVLNFELVSYVATTGKVEFWIQVPTVSHSSDTVIYMFYANAAVTTYQGNTNATWESSFKLVNHYGDGTTLSLSDSTSNGINGTNSSPAVLATAGKIGGAGSSRSAGTPRQAYVTYPDGSFPAGSNDRTVGLWILFPDFSFSSGYDFQMGNFLTGNQGFSFSPLRGSFPSATTPLLYDGANANFMTAQSFSANTWYYFVYTFTNSSKALKAYLNGSLINTFTLNSLNTTYPGTMYTFETNPAVFNANDGSSLDELRIANVSRSADYILTEFNNQNSPSTFYTIGTENNVVTGGLFRIGNLSGIGVGGFFFQNPLN